MRYSAVLASLTVLIACGSPTQPGPGVAQPIGSPTRLAVIEWRFGERITSIRVQATWGHDRPTSLDVTSEAALVSTDTAVMRVTGAGQIESVSAGNATLQVSYRDVRIEHSLRVFPGESPLLVITGGHMSATVYDATTTGPNARRIDGVLVEILSGHNAGFTSITDQHGWYYFYPPFVCGPITMRASKPGYRERVGSSVACERDLPELSLTPIR
jgi:hypothetical protein